MSTGAFGPNILKGSTVCAALVGFAFGCQLAPGQQAAQISPDAEQVFVRGTTALQSGNYDNAVRAFQKVVELDKDFPPAYLNLGLAFHSLNEHAKAIASLTKALELDDRLEGAALFLGIEYVEINFPEKARKPLERAVTLKPSDPDGHLWLGRALMAVGQFKQAIPELQIASAAYPQDIEIRYAVARAYLLVSQQMLDEIYQQAPHSPYTHYVLGHSFQALGKSDLAITEFKLAIQGNPNLRGAHSALGDLYYEKVQYDQALEEYQKELSLDPYNVLVACKTYDILIRHGRVDESIAPLEKINRERPGFYYADYELGRAFMQKRNYERAVKYLQTAVASMPNYAPGYDLLAQAYARLGRTKEAEDALAKSKRLQERKFLAHEILPSESGLPR